MTDAEAEQVIIWYRRLEAQLETILETVPLTYENQKVYLPLLAPLMVEAGSLIDTVFRDEYPSPESRKADIKVFGKYFEKQNRLSNVKSLLFQHPPRYITPFYGWTSDKTGNYIEKKWWTNYNYLKHNRIKKHSLATLEGTVHIICALHQIIALLPIFTRALWRHNLLHASNNVHYVGQNIDESQVRFFGIVETSLFATPIGNERFPAEVEEIVPFWFGGQKLARFLGRA